MLELYHAPQSTCSQTVRFALAEKNLDWVDHGVKLAKDRVSEIMPIKLLHIPVLE